MSRADEHSFTRHARSRMQQRGIPPALVDRVLRYGREVHDHHGAVVVLIDRAAGERLRRDGEARGAELDRLRGVYVVVGIDGTVRTVGHRTRRLHSH